MARGTRGPAARNLGTAYMAVLPDMSNFRREMMTTLARVSQGAGREIQDSISQGATQGLQDAQRAARQLAQTTGQATSQSISSSVSSSMTTNVTNNITNTISNSVSTGVTTGVQQGAQTAQRTVQQSTQGATRAGTSTGTRGGLLAGFSALAGIAAGAFATAGIVQLLSDAVMEGLETGFTARQMSAKLNLDTEGREGLEQALKNLQRRQIFDEEALNQAAEAAILANTGMETASKEFEGLVTSLATLGTTFDVDLGMLAAPLGDYVRRGGSGEDYVQMIVGGLQSTSGDMSDLTDSLAEYSSEFAGAEQEFISLAAFLTGRGLRNTDVLADSVREMRLRASERPEGWDDAIKAMGLDPKEVAAAAEEGGKVWLDTIAQVLQRAPSVEGGGFSTLMELLGGGPLGDYANVFSKIGDDWKNFNSGAAEGVATVEELNKLMEEDPLVQWKQMKATFNEILRSIGEPILEYLIPSFEKMKNWVTENEETLKEFGNIIAEWVIPKIEWFAEKIGDLITWVTKNKEVAGVLVGVLAIGLAGALVLAAAAFIIAAKAAIVAALPFVAAAYLVGLIIFALWRLHKGVVETFGSWGELAAIVGRFFVTVWQGWSWFVVAISNAIAGFFSGLWTWWDRLIVGIWTSITTFFSNMGKAITNTITGLWDSVVSFFTGIGNAIGDFFGGLWSWVEGIFTGIGDFFSTIFGWIQELIDGITSLGGLASGVFAGRASGGWGGIFGGIPAMADGGTVRPQAGGTIVRLAEAGRAETVVDTGLMNQHLSSTLQLLDSRDAVGGDGGNEINVSGNIIIQADSADTVRTLHKKISNVATFDGRRKR